MLVVARRQHRWRKAGFSPICSHTARRLRRHLVPVGKKKQVFSPQRKRGFRLRIKACGAFLLPVFSILASQTKIRSAGFARARSGRSPHTLQACKCIFDTRRQDCKIGEKQYAFRQTGERSDAAIHDNSHFAHHILNAQFPFTCPAQNFVKFL